MTEQNDKYTELLKEKYKLLYEISNEEYKAENLRFDSVIDKASKLFALLNVLISLLFTLIISKYFLEVYTKLNTFFRVITILLFISVLIFLLVAWLKLFKLFKNKISFRIDLKNDNELEKIVDDDTKHVNHLYFVAYRAYQKSIAENANQTDSYFIELQSAWRLIQYAFACFSFVVIELLIALLFIGVTP